MREKYEASTKTGNDPFTEFLYELSMDGCDDEFGSVDEFGYWVGRLGHHALIEDSYGAVYAIRFESPDDKSDNEAWWEWMVEYFGQERIDEYMSSGEAGH